MLHGPKAPLARAWIVGTIVLAALLSLPVAAWLLAPRAHAARRPPAVEQTAAAPRERAPRRLPRVDLPLPPPALPDPIPAAGAEAGAPVAGVVLDPDGKAVEGAVVRCADRDPEIEVKTDGEGRFEVDPGAEGCSAFARHEGFAASDRVVLSARRRNTITLNSPGGIDGEVVDDHGAPVDAYLIAIESFHGAAEDAPMGRSMKIADAAGAFAWPSLPPGDYVLTAAAPLRPPVHSDSIPVEIGRTTHHVRITLPLGATLTGRVIDAASRAPVAQAAIALDSVTFSRADVGATVVSDEAGAYTLEGAPAGPFSIRVSHAGYRTRLVTGLTARGGALRQDVELHAGSEGLELAGIGAGLRPTPAGATVASLVPSGPAEQAGLQVGDRIARIEGADASALPLVDAIQRLRGPEGTRVSVQVDRGGQRVDVTIQRRLFTQ